MRPTALAFLAAIAAFGLAPGDRCAAAGATDRLAYWETPRKGANCANKRVTADYWRAARAAGIEFVRLAPDKWPATQRDVLVGDCDRFTGIDPTDLERLRVVLDDAAAAGVHVVLTLYSVPGARWKQNNGDRDDARLWTTAGYHEQVFRLWGELATALRDHPAIVGYNPLNEPHPERTFKMEGADDAAFESWMANTRGTPADLDAFNRGLVAAIRAADPETPILLEGGSYASPEGLVRLAPLEGSGIFYSFHVYDPWEYTTFRVNKSRYTYPGAMPTGWTPQDLPRKLQAVAAWVAKHGVPASHIVVSEFGVDRRVGGAAQYLSDCMDAFEARGWHWAFFSFREDGSWGGLDYELGTAPFGAGYWKAVEGGQDPETLKRRGPNPLWDVIARRLRPAEH